MCAGAAPALLVFQGCAIRKTSYLRRVHVLLLESAGRRRRQQAAVAVRPPGLRSALRQPRARTVRRWPLGGTVSGSQCSRDQGCNEHLRQSAASVQRKEEARPAGCQPVQDPGLQGHSVVLCTQPAFVHGS